MKKLSVILAVFIGVSFLSLSTLGMHFMHEDGGMIMMTDVENMSDHQEMPGSMRCIFQGICFMSPWEHFRHYKELFAAISPDKLLLSLSLILAIGFFLKFHKRIELFLREFLAFIFEQTKIFSRLKFEQVPRVVNPILQTFARRYPRLYA